MTKIEKMLQLKKSLKSESSSERNQMRFKAEEDFVLNPSRLLLHFE